MADTIGTVRVELVADPSGIQRGIEEASAALTRVAAVGTFVGNVLAQAFLNVVSKVKELSTELLEGHGDIWDQLSGNAQNAVSLISHAFDGMKESVTSVWAELIERLSPAFAVLVEQLAGVSEGGSLARAVFDGVVFVFQKLIQAGVFVVATFRDLMVSLEALGSMAARLGQTIGEVLSNALSPSKAAEAWRQGMADIGRIHEDANKRITEIWQDAGRRINEIQEGVAVTAERAGGRLRHVTDEMKRHFNQLVEAGKRVFEQTRTPAELLELRIGRLNEMLQAGAISWDTYNRAVQMAKDRISGVREAMQQIGQSFEQAFVDAVTGAKSLSDALRDLLKDLARIAAQQVFRQLFGQLFGFVGGGGKSGFGAGFPGFASGGSFKVGGAGGVDSQMVAFRASPDEMVHVTKPGQGMGGGVAVVQPRVTVNNYTSAEVSSRMGAEEELEITVRGLVRDEFNSSRMNPIMAGKHGIRPRVRAR